MNSIIFAGGAGTRLWPVSREKTPKQFEKLFDGKSTLQLAYARIKSFGASHIFLSTAEQYAALVKKQLPKILDDHLLLEPTRRDLAAAVGLALHRMKKRGAVGTVALLWADHLMQHPDRFVQALKDAEALIERGKTRLVFFAEKPRFANHNLGWIHVGPEAMPGVHTFLEWKYRPELSQCENMFASKEWFWNPGYFVFDIDFILSLYAKHQPTMNALLQEMAADESKIHALYRTLEAVHFDTAIIEKVDPKEACVLPVEFGWSDPGTLYALKEALAPKQTDNAMIGNVCTHETQDSLVYNEEKKKLVATIGLNGVMVVNTKDALLVCHKDRVPEIKALLMRLKDEGLEQYL